MKMDVLNLFDISNAKELMELLIVYHSLPEAVEGFKYIAARRLLTVSLEEGDLEEAKGFLADLKVRAILLPVLHQRLEVWLQNLPASNSLSILAIDRDKFQRLLDREIARLQDPGVPWVPRNRDTPTQPEIIQNTVRE